MINYFVRRIGILFITLLVISLVAFALSQLAPGDPVEAIIGQQEIGGLRSEFINYQKQYEETARDLGLDKPVFYFSLTTSAHPDTLYLISDKDHREMISKLIAHFGNWPAIESYYHQIKSFDYRLYELPDTLAPDAINEIRSNLRDLYFLHQDPAITARLQRIEKAILADTALQLALQSDFDALKNSYLEIAAAATPQKLWLPKFRWNGMDNQYHNWFTNFLVGDFGRSYYNGRPVKDSLWDALRRTLLLNCLAIFFAYILSILIGVYSGVHRNSRFDRLVTLGLFVLYSLPSFWIATMLVVFFATPEYGMNFFPVMGLHSVAPDAGFWMRFWDTVWHLTLPVFCLTYPALAFIARQMRGGVLNVSGQDFIRTARAKGLGERQVVWKHIFWNAVFPIITLFASVFPAVLAGSVVIEYIFNIPGMGQLTIDSISKRDWPIVYMVLMLSGVMTMIGILMADIMYALVDPRVSFRKKRA